MAPTPVTDHSVATRDDIRRLEQLIADLQAALDRIDHDQKVQFTRIAQLQADIDLIRGAWSKVTPEAERPNPKYEGPERRPPLRKTR